MIKIKKLEGHYTIKIVARLPKKGNSNWLYSLEKDNLSVYYLWTTENKFKKVNVSVSGLTTEILSGNNVDITGAGTTEDPYIVSATQVKTDWDSFEGPSLLLNKPDLSLYLPQFTESINNSVTPLTININMNASSGTYYIDSPTTQMTILLNPGTNTPEGYVQKIYVVQKIVDAATIGASVPIVGASVTNATISAGQLLEYVYEGSKFYRVK